MRELIGRSQNTTPPLMKIEKNIPIPSKNTGQTNKWRVLFKSMKVGDSITLETEKERAAILRSADYHKIKITTRKIDGQGFRAWRTADEQTN